MASIVAGLIHHCVVDMMWRFRNVIKPIPAVRSRAAKLGYASIVPQRLHIRTPPG
jgi:hypothetical protein